MLTSNQRVLFDNIKNPTLNEHLNLLESAIDGDGFLNGHNHKLENVVSQMMTSDDHVDKILLKLI